MCVYLQGCSNHTVQHPCEEKQCTVRANELWTYTNRDGIFSVPVVKSCYPTWHHCLADCVRKPNILYMFPQSKYQTRVDLGKCTGNCTGEKTEDKIDYCITSFHHSQLLHALLNFTSQVASNAQLFQPEIFQWKGQMVCACKMEQVVAFCACANWLKCFI